MSGIDEIIGYQKNPDDDLYGMLNCSEHSTVSVSCGNVGGDNGWTLIIFTVTLAPGHR